MSGPYDRNRISYEAPSITDSAEFALSEHPDLSNQTAIHHTVSEPMPAAARDPFELANPYDSERPIHDAYNNAPQVEAHTEQQHNRTGSIRSFIARHTSRENGVRRSRESHESGSTRIEETEPKALEEEEKPRVGPEHLLASIAEAEDEEEDEDYLVDVKQAADLDQASAIQDTESTKVRRKGYRENLNRHRHIRRTAGSSPVVRYLRRLYTDVLSKTRVTRSLIYWLPLACLLFIPLAADAFGKKTLELGHIRVMWLFIWLEVAWGALFVCSIVSHYVPEIAGFFVSIICPQYFKFIDAFVALEFPLTLVLWSLVSMITFIPVSSTNHEDMKHASGLQTWQRIVNNILVALLVSALVFFIEQVFIHFLSVSYHRTRMAQRIKRNKQAINIVTLLLYASYRYFPAGSPEFAEEDELLASTVLAHSKLAERKFGKVMQKWKLVSNVQRAIDTTANQLSSIGRELRNGSSAIPEKIVKNALPNKISRETLANRIWKSLVMEDSDALSYEDVLSAIGEDKKEEASYIFEILDEDGQGDVSLDEMVSAIRAISKEQKNISRSLQDIDGAITKLHHVLMIIFLIIMIVIFVGMLSPSVGTVLATLGSSLLALSFIFSATAQEILASCVYLFVKHPCDVGDVVFVQVPGVGYQRMVVTEMSLLYTAFRDDSTNMVRQASNAILNTLFIDNVTRSPPMTVILNLVLGLPETTMEDIEELRRRLIEFLSENSRDYMPSPYLQVTDHPDLDRLKVTISCTMRNNQVDSTMFGNRRTRLFEFISRCISDIGMYVPRREDATHTDPAMPMFISNLERDSSQGASMTFGKRTTYGMVTRDDSDTDKTLPHTSGDTQIPTQAGTTGTNTTTNTTSFRRTNSQTSHRSQTGLRTRKSVRHDF